MDPAEEPDPVIEHYRAGVDRTLLRANLGLSPAERVDKFFSALSMVLELRRAGERLRGREGAPPA
jgi:hypothetical protein